MKGKIFFLGAGPGDPELITLKGARVLGEADIIVYAGSLVPEALLIHARKDAKIYDSKSLTLEEILKIMIDAAEDGAMVARLHSGDPSVYGAIAEQIKVIEEKRIPFEIIPGVSSFQAAAAALKTELTIPDVAQTVILTRASGKTKVPPREELVELARHGTTLVLFLSATHSRKIKRDLLTAYPPDTPLAVVYRVTWPDEKIVRGTLADLEKIIRREKLTRTTLIFVGPALAERGKRSKLYDKGFSHLFRRAIRS